MHYEVSLIKYIILALNVMLVLLLIHCSYHAQSKTEDIYANETQYHKPALVEADLYAQIKSCGIQSIDRNSIE